MYNRSVLHLRKAERNNEPDFEKEIDSHEICSHS